jgi:hypothetical protein
VTLDRLHDEEQRVPLPGLPESAPETERRQGESRGHTPTHTRMYPSIANLMATPWLSSGTVSWCSDGTSRRGATVAVKIRTIDGRMMYTVSLTRPWATRSLSSRSQESFQRE